MTRQLSLDIETTPCGDRPDFDDPESWHLFAIALGFRSDGDVETTVFVRQNGTIHAERKLLAQSVNWIRDREPLDVLLSYNGDDFDLPILEARAEALLKSDRPQEQTLSFALFDALNISHRDLFAELKARCDDDEKWPSLDDALADRGIEAASTTLEGSTVTGADMPRIGRDILANESTADARRALVEYASSDVAPLFALADALSEERAEVLANGGRP